MRLWHSLFQNRSWDAFDARYGRRCLVDDEGNVVSAFVLPSSNLTPRLCSGLSPTLKVSFPLVQNCDRRQPRRLGRATGKVCRLFSNWGQYANAFAQTHTKRIQYRIEGLKQNEDDSGSYGRNTVSGRALVGRRPFSNRVHRV